MIEPWNPAAFAYGALCALPLGVVLFSWLYAMYLNAKP